VQEVGGIEELGVVGRASSRPREKTRREPLDLGRDELHLVHGEVDDAQETGASGLRRVERITEGEDEGRQLPHEERNVPGDGQGSTKEGL
jgi:hypothetical protein